MKKSILCLILCLMLGGSAQAQSRAKDYSQTLREFLTVSGSLETMQQVIPQMVGMMKLQYPSIPTEIWDELQKEIELSMSNEFFQMLVPIYQKYLTQDDLEAIITFYKSPAGSKMASVAPQISGEAMQTGQLLGMQIGMKVYDKLKDKGLID